MVNNKSYWLGIRIIQTPMSLREYQQVIWEVKPDLIIETGIRFGGSLVFSASMLILLEACGEIENGEVVGIDIVKRNLKLPLSEKITILQGSSTEQDIITKLMDYIFEHKKVLVFLDSNHTHDHVLTELKTYSQLVNIGSYVIVEDTGLEDVDYYKSIWINRGWVKGSNPKTAVWEFLEHNDNFVIDERFTTHPDGYLKRIK